MVWGWSHPFYEVIALRLKIVLQLLFSAGSAITSPFASPLPPDSPRGGDYPSSPQARGGAASVPSSMPFFLPAVILLSVARPCRPAGVLLSGGGDGELLWHAAGSQASPAARLSPALRTAAAPHVQAGCAPAPLRPQQRTEFSLQRRRTDIPFCVQA